MLVFHADVNASRMSQEIIKSSGHEDYEQSEKTDNYQYPQKPTTTNNKLENTGDISSPPAHPYAIFYSTLHTLAYIAACQYVTPFLYPRYHLWLAARRLEKKIVRILPLALKILTRTR